MLEIWRKLIEKAKVPRVVTIIGGGGKTSLMYYLVTAMKDAGYNAIAATTTKLSNRVLSGNHFVEISSVDAGYEAVEGARGIQDHVTLVSHEDKATGKMVGIPSLWIDQLAIRCKDVIFVVEADGSAGKSLKGHLGYEPVIPNQSSLVIPVIGIDCVGMELNSQSAHRPEIICELTRTALTSVITTKVVTQLLVHPQGYLHNCSAGNVVVPFINKVESVIQYQQAEEVAWQILTRKHPQISGVVIGSLRQKEGLWLQV